MQLPKVINNISERVVDDLKQKLSDGSRVSIAAATFSIYAYEALKEELEGAGGAAFYLHLAHIHQGQSEEGETRVLHTQTQP